jgi:hypothetical protein
VPSFSMSPVRLISVSRYSLSRTSRYFGVVLTLFCLQGVYGPFQPPAKAVVPLWLALSLKRKRKCRIIGPEWLTIGMQGLDPVHGGNSIDISGPALS